MYFDECEQVQQKALVAFKVVPDSPAYAQKCFIF